MVVERSGSFKSRAVGAATRSKAIRIVLKRLISSSCFEKNLAKNAIIRIFTTSEG